MDKKSWDKTLKQAEQLVRSGQIGAARDLLTSTNMTQIPRTHLFSFADLARRVNTPKIIVSLLRPIVLSEFPGAAPATPQEKALYATGLSRLGCFAEAHAIFKKIEISSAPEALLFQAQNFMLQWDDLSAIPILKIFISIPKVSAYLRLVGKVNLASCLIYENKWLEGQRLLEQIRNEIEAMTITGNPIMTDHENFKLLYANSLEISAQSALLQNQFTAALEYVFKGQKFLEGTKSRYELLLKKWGVIIGLLNAPSDKNALTVFIHLKQEALKARNWETYRDLEFYQAKALQDESLFIKIYYGTPHVSYRRRIKKIFSSQIKPPKTFIWKLQDSVSSESNLQIFDARRGQAPGSKVSLASSPLLFKLFQILIQDFYRPIPVGALIYSLYQGEVYDPISSFEKSYQAVKRLRKWFKDNKIPLEIDVTDNNFKLTATENYGILLTFEKQPVEKNDLILERLLNHYTTDFFTAKNVATELNLSISLVRTFLKWAVKQKKIIQLAQGRSARYRRK